MTKPLAHLALLLALSAAAQQPARIPPGAKVFVAPMDGLGPYLTLAFFTKKVPLVTVTSASQADYLIDGSSHTEEPGRLKKLVAPGAAKTDASITIKDKAGNTVWTCAVDKYDAQIPNQSAAESCAKHLKEWMAKK